MYCKYCRDYSGGHEERVEMECYERAAVIGYSEAVPAWICPWCGDSIVELWEDTMQTFYVVYANYGGYPVYIELIDEARYNDMKRMRPKDERLHRALIHVDSTREDDPIIEIVVITEHKKLGQARAQQIDQEVINWLMDKGHMPKR